MKKTTLSLIPLLFLSGCVIDNSPDNDKDIDIECQDQENGWHRTEETIEDAEGKSYLFEGEWHCENEKLWYSSIEDELNLFGRGYVTASTDDGDSQKFQYAFKQLNKAQNFIVELDGTNERHNNDIKSFDLTLSFSTKDGVLEQLIKIEPYSGDSYAIEYNGNNALIHQFSKTIFKSKINDLYRYGTSECEAEDNMKWECAHWDSFLDDNRVEQDKHQGNNTSKIAEITIDSSKLENPLTTRDELIRIGDTLFK